MVPWLALLGLPKEVFILIVAAVLLLVMSIIAVVFPDIGTFIFAVILFVAGFFFIKTTIKVKSSEISIGGLLVLMGAIILIANLVAINFSFLAKSFVVSTMSVVSVPMMAVSGTSCGVPGVFDVPCPSIDLNLLQSFLVVVVGATAIVLLLDKFYFKNRLFKLKKKWF